VTVRVKICGLRTEADVRACVDAGADAVGFNFYPRSKRYVTAEQAAPLARALPASVWKVGVFVGAPPNEVAEHIRAAGLTHAQLHGDEVPAEYAQVGAPLVQVIRVKDRASLSVTPSPDAGVVLLDTFVAGFGGGGETFDWRWVGEATAGWKVPVVLAGGLTPDNVADAIQQARPWGVDVASGVESAPGLKDAARVKAFVQAAREASEALARSNR
jgi:phosphoribosylanthranilate isomerase